MAACFVAMVVHSLGYADFTVDPATWALLGLGVALRRRRAAAIRGRRSQAATPASAPAARPATSRRLVAPLAAMFEYLRRLATTGAAYTASSVVSKLIAVFLLPIYTHYLTPSDYGAAEVMLASVIAASIVVRFGVIEAILRFYYLAGRAPASGRGSTGFASLFWGATIRSPRSPLPFAGPISQALLGHEDAGLARLAILGLWTLTLYEYALTLLRLDERARAYFGITVANVLVTIPFTVWLIVVEGERASGILLGTYATGAAVHGRGCCGASAAGSALVPDLPAPAADVPVRAADDAGRAVALLAQLHRPDHPRSDWRASPRRASTRSRSSSPRAMQVLARGFQLAWPPLAYSIQDDDEARRVYSAIFTWFAAAARLRGERACGSSRAGSSGCSPRRTSSRPTRRSACWPRASPSTRLYLAMVVILGRTGRTEFSFPATIAAVATNVVLNLVLVPSHGIVGAGLALVGSYVVVLVLMYAFTQRLFPVPYEWRRLALVVLVGGGAGRRRRGCCCRPPASIGLREPHRALARLPAVLLAFGFLHEEERTGLARAPAPVRDRRARPRPARGDGARRRGRRGRAPGSGPRSTRSAARDEDRSGT